MTLQVVGIEKSFGDVRALAGCDLSVERGRLVGFLGPNGAGKTTTMRAVMGLVDIDAGAITWDGQPVGRAERRRIGYLPQERGLYVRMSVFDHVVYIGRVAGLPAADAARRADEWIDRVGLRDRRDDHIQDLSVGNQQRVQLAVAMVHDPEILILDEPFAGLDPVAVATLSEVMDEQVAQGKAVVFSSHQLDLVQDLCEDVTVIAEGATVATGRVNDLRDASPRRHLTVRWTEGGVVWTPAQGRISTQDDDTTVVDLPTGVDPAALIADAATAGSIASVSFEPPGLEDVFLELVGSPQRPERHP